MGKIIVSENVTLDGVVQDPTGEEGFSHGGWSGQIGDKDRAEWAKLLLDEALGTEALLLGRRSDEWFAARWASRLSAGSHTDGAWSCRRTAADGLPGRGRGGRAAVQREKRQDVHAAPQHPDAW